MKRQKQVHKKGNVRLKKEVVLSPNSQNTGFPIFRFDRIDKQGAFAFDTTRTDFKHKDFLDKMIAYSQMTWAEIARQTHDSGKSKHHYVKEIQRFSPAARERLKSLKLEDFSDDLFSFALNNKLRIIGLRLDDHFHVLWYDSEHLVYPSVKKHT